VLQILQSSNCETREAIGGRTSALPAASFNLDSVLKHLAEAGGSGTH
jgi:hypothetical protein